MQQESRPEWANVLHSYNPSIQARGSGVQGQSQVGGGRKEERLRERERGRGGVERNRQRRRRRERRVTRAGEDVGKDVYSLLVGI